MEREAIEEIARRRPGRSPEQVVGQLLGDGIQRRLCSMLRSEPGEAEPPGVPDERLEPARLVPVEAIFELSPEERARIQKALIGRSGVQPAEFIHLMLAYALDVYEQPIQLVEPEGQP
jgi:hypothetical protein